MDGPASVALAGPFRRRQTDPGKAVGTADMVLAEQQRRSDGAGQHPVKLSCRHIWKLFGQDADTFLKGRATPDAEALAAAGLVGAVRDVSLDVPEGEIFIVMGLSGSGKSTLLRCLSRLIEPTAGEVAVRRPRPAEGRRARDDRDPPPQDGHGVPELRPAAAPQRAGQCRLPARDPGRIQIQAHRPRARGHRAGRTQGPRALLSAPAVGRAAAARRHRALPRRRARNCGSWTSRSPHWIR